MLPRQLVGLLHLRENLRLAEHHAVQAGGHAKQMAHGCFASSDDELAADFLDRHVMKAGEVASQ